MKLNKPSLTALMLSAAFTVSAFSQDKVPQYAGDTGDLTTIDFTYYDGEAVNYTGYDGQSRQSAAIAVDPAAIQGMKIKSIYAVGFTNGTDFGNLHFWASSILGHDHTIVDSDVCPVENGKAMITFDEAIDVPETEFYVGYDFQAFAQIGSFIPYSTGPSISGTAYITYGRYSFSDYSGFMGPLTIGMILESPEPLSENSLLLTESGEEFVVKSGDPCSISVKAFNNGTNPVEMLTYVYEVGGKSNRLDLTLPDPIQPSLTAGTVVNLPIDPIEEPGEYTVTVSVPKINGVENNNADSSAQSNLIVTSPIDESVFEGTIPFAYSQEPANDWYFAGARKCTYDVGMRIKSPEFVGMEVVGARVKGLTHNDGVGNFRGWLTSELSNSFDIETVMTGSPDGDGDLIIVFKEPYKLGEKGVYIGYSCDVLELTDESKKCIPLYVTFEEGKFTDGCLINCGYGWSDEGYWNGCATTITAYLRGELADDNVYLGKMTSHSVVEKDTPYTLEYELYNNGGNEVKEIKYSYTVNGVENTATKTLEQSVKPGIGVMSPVNLSFDGVSEPGSYSMSVKVTEVNGMPNNSIAAASPCTVNVIDHRVDHRVLMEEATGTWCGYCPRGWIAMREMAKMHSDFIGIAYHDGDPMAVGYIPFDNAGFPYASLDRTVNGDPYYGTQMGSDFGMESDWQTQRDQLTYATIDITAEWRDEAKSALDVTSSVQFVLPIENANYEIGYTLVNSGYSHRNIDWAQHNYYSGTAQTGILTELSALPSYILDMVYDDVAICSDFSWGVAGSLPSTIENGAVYTHEQTFETESIIGPNGDELLEDKSRVEVVAFIIAPDGKIVNACKKSPGIDISSVNGVADGAEVVNKVYFTLDGKALSNPVGGIFLEKTILSDGSMKVKKIHIR